MQNGELENLFKNALQENRKLQDALDTGKVISDRQTQDLQNERLKVTELTKHVESLSKEKQRVQTLCDSVKKRADDAEKSLTQIVGELQALQLQVDKGKDIEKLGEEIKEKVAILEKENLGYQKEIARLKEIIEAKDVELDQQVDKYNKQEKEIQHLQKEHENTNSQIEKLLEFEQKAQELLSQAAVYTETISTLQKDLISEKLNNEKFKCNLEKLGLNLDILDNDINVVVEKMLAVPEISKCIAAMLKESEEPAPSPPEPAAAAKCTKCSEIVEKVESDVYTHAEEVVSSISAEWNQQCEKLCAEISNLQQLNESLQTENARMQVDISTLTSQVSSLTTQQTALQLANSQLVAEKDEVSKRGYT